MTLLPKPTTATPCLLLQREAREYPQRRTRGQHRAQPQIAAEVRDPRERDGARSVRAARTACLRRPSGCRPARADVRRARRRAAASSARTKKIASWPSRPRRARSRRACPALAARQGGGDGCGAAPSEVSREQDRVDIEESALVGVGLDEQARRSACTTGWPSPASSSAASRSRRRCGRCSAARCSDIVARSKPIFR